METNIESSHADLEEKKRPGGKIGNTNSLKHGRYSKKRDVFFDESKDLLERTRILLEVFAETKLCLLDKMILDSNTALDEEATIGMLAGLNKNAGNTDRVFTLGIEAKH